MEPSTGIEPMFPEYETGALPLYYEGLKTLYIVQQINGMFNINNQIEKLFNNIANGIRNVRKTKNLKDSFRLSYQLLNFFK